MAQLSAFAGGNLLFAGAIGFVILSERTLLYIPLFSMFFSGGLLLAMFLVYDLFGVSPECYISIYRGRKVVVMSAFPRLCLIPAQLTVHSLAALMLTVSLDKNDGHLIYDGFFWIMVFPFLLMSLATISGAWMGWPRVILRSDAVIIHWKFSETVIPWEKVVRDDLGGRDFRIKVAARVRAERRFRILFGLNIPTPLIQVPYSIDLVCLYEGKYLYNQWEYASRVVDFYLANAEARERLGTRESLREIRDEELRTRPYLVLPDMDERVNCPEGCQCCPLSLEWDNRSSASL
ncbi:hypothetical protein [Austwickia chelonae]|uniref:hypothetical protein n=1 Tax=Austwickia chelonae TaxID=100225 RepID=UPI0005916B86|nr:hypothetical protein [Austwickia chelonae]